MKEIICNLCGSNRNVVVYRSQQKIGAAVADAYLITEKILVPPEKILKCVI